MLTVLLVLGLFALYARLHKLLFGRERSGGNR